MPSSFASFLGPAPDLQCRGHCGTAGDAAEYALLLRQLPRHVHRVRPGNLHNLIDKAGVRVVGNETSTDSLDLVRAGLASTQDCTLNRLNGDDLHVRVERFQVLAAAREGTPCAD